MAKRWVKCHRDACRLAMARDALDADVFRIHRRIRLQVIESASRAPSPRAQRSPVIRLARLALVNEPDDAAGESGPVVGLDAGGVDGCKTPPFRDDLPSRGRVA